MQSKGIDYNKLFDEEYQKLNTEQKKAVDQIEGPVLVNAGPGTGKTQILATRIGKILMEQEIAPHNILCLTYTDSATIAMRNRLVKIIGPTAHQIHINTFHAFCNQVIQENLEYFGGYRKLEPVSDLEVVDVMQTLIDNLENDNPLKRFKGDRYYESGRMRNLFLLMKKENISKEEMLQKIDTYITQEKDNDTYITKRKTTKNGKTYVKGDFRDDKYADFVKGFDPLIAAVNEYENFIALMMKIERYDYADMILWVLDAFQKSEDLLLKYQERYQYFLVDEYQDTNGAQNDILNYLTSYWDIPNVFVVGDDDQAIYKFQGANLGNIIDFKNKNNPFMVVLRNNYRSNQKILDVSKVLIEFNQERIINQLPEITKELVAEGTHKNDTTIPKLLGFEKTSHEIAYLASTLEALYKNAPDEFNSTAVIYRKHKQVDELVQVLEKRNVPLNIKKRINILELPIIKNLLNILRYLQEEYARFGKGEGYIFEILHYNYFGVHSSDIGKIAIHCQKRIYNSNDLNDYSLKKWRDVISSEEELKSLELKNPNSILQTSEILDKWISEIPEVTLQTLFENVINEGGILEYAMRQNNKSWLLQVISTLFDFIKKESVKKHDLSLKEFLEMLDKMKENNIDIPVNKIISSENGVNFITAHSSKGLEFKRVYIIGTTSKIWDKSPSSWGHYKYPEGMNADSDTNTEDERRLFYVAMTRAETDLNILFSAANEEGKVLAKSQFIDEIMASIDLEVTPIKVDDHTVAEFYYNLLKREDKQIELIETNLIDKWMDGYRLSVTHLNKYLQCPLTFYFEVILKVPHGRNAYSGFGTAMHGALYDFYTLLNKKEPFNLDRLNFFFEENMKAFKSNFTDKEFESFMVHGKKCIEQLYEHKKEEWSQEKKYALEEKLEHSQYKGIPIKGFIDKVEIFKDHVHVVDYKTGDATKTKTAAKLKQPNEKNENGGDYWRQIVFYKILIDSDTKNNWNMISGEVEFVEPNKKTGSFINHQIAVQPNDIDFVGQQIIDTMENIKNYNFDTTCEDDDCMWCNFVKDNYRINPELKDHEFNYE